MQIKIYDKYIFKQVCIATLVCIILFVVVWIAPETMLKVVRRTLNGTYTVSVGMQLLLYEIPKILNKALPIGIFLGTLFTFDKLSKDSEITIFRTAGMSTKRIIVPVVLLSIIVTILCFIVNDKIGPYSCNKLNDLKNETASSNLVYISKDKYSHPRQIVIFPNYHATQVSQPVIMNFSNVHYADVSELEEIIIGEKATLSEKELTIDNGKKYSIDSEGIFERTDEIKDFKAISEDKAPILFELAKFKLKRDRELTNKELVHYIKLLKQEELNDEYRGNLNKYLQRYFHSLMCILFAILGCFLGFSRPREQRLTGFIIAISLTFLYYITLPPIDVAAEKGYLSPILAAMFHPLLLLVAIFVTKKIKAI